MSLFDTLDREWEWMMASSRIARVTNRWNDPVLNRFEHPRQMIDFVQERGHPVETDDVLRALVKLAPRDDFASRLVLQALMPGMRSIARRYGWAEQRDELASIVVASVHEKIRRYPLDRRSNRIASNVINDARRSLHDRFADRRAVEVPTGDIELDCIAESRRARTAADRVGVLVSEAVKRGVVSQEDARLIIETRVFDTPIESLTAQEGINAQSLRRRRLRAETRIAEADLSLSI